MKHYILLCVISGCLLQSCNSIKQTELNDQDAERFLSELALIYWDFNYTFPTSYLQSRDTNAWFFSQYTSIDSILLCHAPDIMYTNQDTSLLITYKNDTIALIHLPCSCDWTDEIPYGPRAYDNLNRMILDDIIHISWQGDQVRLTYDIVHSLQPAIKEQMNKIGYIQIDNKERKQPQYLLVEYLSYSDSIQLIKVCEKYKNYFYDEYAITLKKVFSEYCKNNHVSRLLTPVDVYLPVSEKISILNDL